MNSQNIVDIKTDNNSTDVNSIEDILKEYGYDESLLENQEEMMKLLNKISEDLIKSDVFLEILKKWQNVQCEPLKQNEEKENSPKPKVNGYPLKRQHSEEEPKPQRSSTPQVYLKVVPDVTVTMEMARKILDKQFNSRKNAIISNLEKDTIEFVNKKRDYTYQNMTFVPCAASTGFAGLVGFEEVVNMITDMNSENKENEDNKNKKPFICSVCSTECSNEFRKRRLNNGDYEVICNGCTRRRALNKNRREYELQLKNIISIHAENQSHLVRDYQDMIKSPNKMEQYRQEQERNNSIKLTIPQKLQVQQQHQQQQRILQPSTNKSTNIINKSITQHTPTQSTQYIQHNKVPIQKLSSLNNNNNNIDNKHIKSNMTSSTSTSQLIENQLLIRQQKQRILDQQLKQEVANQVCQKVQSPMMHNNDLKIQSMHKNNSNANNKQESQTNQEVIANLLNQPTNQQTSINTNTAQIMANNEFQYLHLIQALLQLRGNTETNPMQQIQQFISLFQTNPALCNNLVQILQSNFNLQTIDNNTSNNTSNTSNSMSDQNNSTNALLNKCINLNQVSKNN